jgi:hypothetical protein
MVRFKQLCNKCKKNYVVISSRNDFAMCYDCQKTDLNQPIKDSKMKKLFDIPEEFYKNNLFLRNIKMYYIRFGKLSDKQIEFFKKSVEKMKDL